MKKKIISAILTAALILGMIPTVFAAVSAADEVKNLTKTASWTNQDKTQAEIQLTSTFDKKIVDGKILFLGGLCNAHTLEGGTVADALNACAKYGTVDYFLYSVNESQTETSGTPITGTLEKSKTLTNTDKNNINNKLNSQRHVIQYKIADKLNSTDLSKYDAVVLEFDGFKMGRQSSAPTAAQRTALTNAAKKLLPLYADGKVLWIIPPKSYKTTYDGTSTYIFGDYYLSNKDISGSSKITDNMRKAAFDCLAIMAPEDYLTADGEAKSYPTFGTSLLESLTTLKARANASEKNRIYVTYDQSENVANFLSKRFSSHGYQTIDVCDEVSDGFVITKVGGQYYDATSETYKTMPAADFSYKVEGQVVTATFNVTKLDYANVRLVIDIKVDEENDPFEDNTTVDTNVGKATAKYMDEDDDGKPVTVHQEDVDPANLSKTEYPITTSVTNGTISPSKYVLDGGSYKVEYAPKANTGYVLDSVTVDGTPVSLVTYPNSYTFTNIKAEHEIIVKYLPTYPVTFDSNGGSAVSPQTIKEGDKATEPADPTKTGYTFDKWYADEDLKVPFDFDTPITKPTTLYGGYTEDEYTLHYDANGGTSSSAPEDQTMVFSKATVISNTEPTWPGHTFKGWSTDPNAVAPEFLPGANFKLANVDKAPDTTLYAVWDSDVVQINYAAGEGGKVSPASETILADPAPDVELKGSTATPDEGYHFTEWKDSSDKTVSTDATFVPEKPGDLYLPATYTAFFAKNKYTVTYDMQDILPDSKETVEHGDYATIPSVPSVTGYDFDKFYKDEKCTVPFDFEKETITKDTTIYGNFTEHTADLTYYMNDGTDNVYGTGKLKYTEKTDLTTGIPTREHYVFLGWDEGPAVTNPTYPKNVPATLKDKNVEPEDIDLYAIWDGEDYTVDFVANGGTPAPEDQTVKYLKTATEPTEPEKTGYTFTGWYTDSGCTQEYDFATPVEKDITLYAGYEQTEYTLSYDANGGTGAPADQKMFIETKTEVSATEPTWTGHNFEGWAVSKEKADAGTVAYAPGALYKAAGVDKAPSATLFAVWSEKETVIHYYPYKESGTPYKEDTIKYSEEENIPGTEPVRPHYVLLGWDKNPDAKIPTYSKDMPLVKAAGMEMGDTILYGIWEKEKYDITFDTTGGTPAPDKQVIEYLDKAGKPATDPKKEGFNFGGWFTDKECTKPYDFNNPVEGSFTLYAKWVMLPKTGDDSHLGLWSVIALSSLCGTAVVLWKRRRYGESKA